MFFKESQMDHSFFFFPSDVTACFPPEIANGNYAESSNGWYENGHKLRIICDEGYEHKDYVATTKCADGQWSSLPVCQSKSVTCSSSVNYKTEMTRKISVPSSRSLLLQQPNQPSSSSSENLPFDEDDCAFTHREL